MHEVINLNNIKITYAGKAFGNMDYNYGAKEDVEKNHKKLIKIINSEFIADIRSMGGNTFIDLDQKNLKKHINFFQCDGLITSNKNVSLTLFPADCIPLVVYSLESNLKALLHVGRRGAEAGLIEKALDYIIKNKKESVENLRFYFGPSISKDSYFFRDIDAGQKESLSWRNYISKKNGNYHVDLVGYTANRLKQIGVKTEQIKYSEINVAHPESSYFSHVRSSRNSETEGRNLFAVESIN